MPSIIDLYASVTDIDALALTKQPSGKWGSHDQEASSPTSTFETRISAIEIALQALDARFALLEQKLDRQVVRETPAKISAMNESLTTRDSAFFSVSPTSNVSYAEKKRKLAKTLHAWDRWGEDAESRLPKSWVGGIAGIFLVVSLLAYTIKLVVDYLKLEPNVTSNIIWSISDGPYPLPLKCFAESCLISLNFSTVSSGSGCASELPQNNLHHCFNLTKGEEIELQTCYSLIEADGVYVSSAGRAWWDQLAPTVHSALGYNAHEYGFATVSDMLGGDAAPVMKFLTPIRNGIHVMDYVKTKNETRPEGSEGALRREWFSQRLDSVNIDPNAGTGYGPCESIQASISSQKNYTKRDWRLTNLRMTPQWTEIVASPPPPWTSLLGEIGGAFELGHLFLALVLVLILRVQKKCLEFSICKRWCVPRSQF